MDAAHADWLWCVGLWPRARTDGANLRSTLALEVGDGGVALWEQRVPRLLHEERSALFAREAAEVGDAGAVAVNVRHTNVEAVGSQGVTH